MAKIRLAIITDGRTAPRFMLDAVRRLENCGEVAVFACTNTRQKRRLLKHAVYYGLNLLAVRNRMTRSLPIETCGKRISKVVYFESLYEGAWQRLPDPIIDQLADFDVILKIGMGLLRIPPEERLRVPILSYHHGDPERFRGRPAGFWEMVEKTPVMGQVVQRLSNALDAGQVLAFAQTKVWPHSWRATLIEAYRHSPLIISEAVRKALAGTSMDKRPTGRNYRLPSNRTAGKFAARMAWQATKRLCYGAVIEKRWSVSVAPVPEDPLAAIGPSGAFPPEAQWHTLRPTRRYSFYADPFFCTDPPGLLVEALDRRTGLGEILFVPPQGGEARRVSPGGGHFSYPATVDLGGEQLVLPETAQSGPPTLYRFEEGMMRPQLRLRLDSEEGLIDPTIHAESGRIYLFANLLSDGPGALSLWSAPAIDARFERHPKSPVLVSPYGGRMAGKLLRTSGRLIRFGQDLSIRYGDGIIAFEVECLSPADYSERPLGAIRFVDRHGPHTLNLASRDMVFDWYREVLSPAAGLRRLLPRLLGGRQLSAGRAAASQQVGHLPDGGEMQYGRPE